jgi:hypothetical protein
MVGQVHQVQLLEVRQHTLAAAAVELMLEAHPLLLALAVLAVEVMAALLGPPLLEQ